MKTKKISVFSLVMINLVAIDSLRNLPANASMGISLIIFYLFSAILFLVPCAMITAEMATHYPKTGGPYVWVREAFGEKWGFLNIWFQWIYNVIWYPTILSFISSNISFLVDIKSQNKNIFNLIVVILAFTLATLVNAFGMQVSSIFSTVMGVVGTFIPMLTIIFLGFIWVFSGNADSRCFINYHGGFSHLFQVHNISFFVIIMFSLMGIEMSANHAEEVQDPARDYPKSLLISSVLIVCTLLFSSLSIAAIVPREKINVISGIGQALILFFSRFHMKKMAYFFMSLIVLGSFGSMSAWVIGPAKGISAASHDNCAPKIFSRTIFNSVPLNVLILQWVIVMFLTIISSLSSSAELWYSALSALASQVGLLFYLILFCAAIKLRYKTPKNAKAYRIPGGNIGIWVVSLSGILCCLIGIVIGFIPPDNIQGIDKNLYVFLLFLGISSVGFPPFVSSSWYLKK